MPKILGGLFEVMEVLILKAQIQTAPFVISNNLYFSVGQPRNKKYAEIWIVGEVKDGRANLLGRYQSADITPITSGSSIPKVFTYSPSWTNWNFEWKLKLFRDRGGNVIKSNISAYNNVWINLVDLHAPNSITHLQTIGYLNLDGNDILTLDTKYGIKFPIVAVAKPATKPVKQPVTKPVKQPVKLKPNVIVGYSLSSAQHIASITPTRDGSDFHITFRESPGKKYSAKHLGLTV